MLRITENKFKQSMREYIKYINNITIDSSNKRTTNNTTKSAVSAKATSPLT
jgi:hypothetical protein